MTSTDSPRARPKYLVCAGSLDEACEWANKNGLNPRPSFTNGWLYGARPQDFRGLMGYEVVIVGRFSERPDYLSITEEIEVGISRGFLSWKI